MTILTNEERAALQAVPLERMRTRRAEALVNPASGLANDYLNLFNEIVMLVEQLPMMPDLFEDIARWHPLAYREYFERSILPGSTTAIENYDRLEPRFRREFESLVAELDRRSTGAVAAVRRQFKNGGDRDIDALTVVCDKAGSTIREVLDRATMLVNHGTIVRGDPVQERTDALFAKLMSAATP